jgi:hypothetical protein
MRKGEKKFSSFMFKECVCSKNYTDGFNNTRSRHHPVHHPERATVHGLLTFILMADAATVKENFRQSEQLRERQ